MKIKVEIIESEFGMGQKVDSIKEFDNFESAERFCTEYNANNNEEKTPEWYMFARIVKTKDLEDVKFIDNFVKKAGRLAIALKKPNGNWYDFGFMLIHTGYKIYMGNLHSFIQDAKMPTDIKEFKSAQEIVDEGWMVD